MSRIIFTRREIRNAWRNSYQVYEQAINSKNNVHRLILFYAVECGLKAVVMERKKKDIIDSSIVDFGHNINKMLDHLHCSNDLKLPRQIQLTPLKNDQQRNCPIEDLNQVWRYGHVFKKQESLDKILEDKLVEISKWINTELSGI